MRGVRYVLFCMVFSIAWCLPVYADEWVLDWIYMEDVYKENDMEVSAVDYMVDDTVLMEYFGLDEEEVRLMDFGEATPSNAYRRYTAVSDSLWLASASNAAGTSSRVGGSVQPMASNGSPDNDLYPDAYVLYAQNIVAKLGPDYHYVFFRNDYEFRLVYAKDMWVDDSSGKFHIMATDARYVLWDYVRYDVVYGDEGDFSLDPQLYVIFTDLTEVYPTLNSGVRNYEFKTLLFLSATLLLFDVVRSFFFAGKFRY